MSACRISFALKAASEGIKEYSRALRMYEIIKLVGSPQIEMVSKINVSDANEREE